MTLAFNSYTQSYWQHSSPLLFLSNLILNLRTLRKILFQVQPPLQLVFYNTLSLTPGPICLHLTDLIQWFDPSFLTDRTWRLISICLNTQFVAWKNEWLGKARPVKGRFMNLAVSTCPWQLLWLVLGHHFDLQFLAQPHNDNQDNMAQ
jgi:hypothetical protein